MLNKLLCLSMFIFVGCKGSIHSSNDLSDEASLLNQATKCKSEEKQWISPDQVTFLYHWTDNKLASDDPISYIKNVIATSREANKKNLDAGMAGAGFYLAADPFSTSSYGSTLLTVPIQRNSSFAFLEEFDSGKLEKMYYTNDCHSIVYPYLSLYEMGRAVSLTETDNIVMDRSKIRAFRVPGGPVTIRNPATELNATVGLTDFITKSKRYLPFFFLDVLSINESPKEKVKRSMSLAIESVNWKTVSDLEPVVKQLMGHPYYIKSIKFGRAPPVQRVVKQLILLSIAGQQAEINLAELPPVSNVVDYMGLSGLPIPQMSSYDDLGRFLHSDQSPFKDRLVYQAILEYFDQFAKDNEMISMKAWKR